MPSYREYPLPPPLDAFVECVWFLRQAPSDSYDDQIQRIPPDGTIELIFHLEAPLSQIEEDRVARILSTHGCERVELVGRGAGISSRQLERTFRNDVGVPPKVLSRIVRFQRVLRVASPGATAGPRSCATSWADIAIGCGYTDQAHLIRDFREFAGETPAALMSSEAAIADYFRRQ